MSDAPKKQVIYTITYGCPSHYEGWDYEDIYFRVHEPQRAFATDISVMNAVWDDARGMWKEFQLRNEVPADQDCPGIIYKHEPSSAVKWVYKMRGHEHLPWTAMVHCIEVTP